jgi:two-component system, NarL family, response regulator DevR
MDADGSSRIRVALIAPHSITRAALRVLLESAPGFEVVAEGEAADVVLIDVPPNSDPAPAVSAAAGQDGAAIVVLVDEEDVSQCSAAIGAGAAGVVARQQTPQTLFAAIDRVRSGGTFIERSLLSSVVRSSKPRDAKADRYHTLSKREREVHALLIEGLKNKEIGQRLFISEATVRHHLTSIFGKLGVSGRLELIAMQWRRTGATGFPRFVGASSHRE